jgi:Lar family restriction alleviation protein
MSYKNIKPNLKPCPFCGEESNFYWGHAHASAFHVKCQTCGGSGAEISYPDELNENITLVQLERRLMREAIAAWNRRYGQVNKPKSKPKPRLKPCMSTVQRYIRLMGGSCYKRNENELVATFFDKEKINDFKRYCHYRGIKCLISWGKWCRCLVYNL